MRVTIDTRDLFLRLKQERISGEYSFFYFEIWVRLPREEQVEELLHTEFFHMKLDSVACAELLERMKKLERSAKQSYEDRHHYAKFTAMKVKL